MADPIGEVRAQRFEDFGCGVRFGLNGYLLFLLNSTICIGVGMAISHFLIVPAPNCPVLPTTFETNCNCNCTSEPCIYPPAVVCPTTPTNGPTTQVPTTQAPTTQTPVMTTVPALLPNTTSKPTLKTQTPRG